MQGRFETGQRGAAVVRVVRCGHHVADVGQQAVGVGALGRGDLEGGGAGPVEPGAHLVEAHPDGADHRGEIGHQGQHGRLLRAVRRLQLQLVARPDPEGLAQVLREHDAVAGEHVGADPVVEGAEEGVVAAGGEPVEHDARAADDGEAQGAFGDLRDPGHLGDLVGKALRQKVRGVLVG